MVLASSHGTKHSYLITLLEGKAFNVSPPTALCAG